MTVETGKEIGQGVMAGCRRPEGSLVRRLVLWVAEKRVLPFREAVA